MILPSRPVLLNGQSGNSSWEFWTGSESRKMRLCREQTLNAYMTVANEPMLRERGLIIKCQSGNARDRDERTRLAPVRNVHLLFLLPEEDAILDAEDDDDIDPFTPGDLWFHAK